MSVNNGLVYHRSVHKHSPAATSG